MANRLATTLSGFLARLRARLRPRTRLIQLRTFLRPRTRLNQFRTFLRPRTRLNQFRIFLRPCARLNQFRTFLRPRTRLNQFRLSVRRIPAAALIAWQALQERRYFARHEITLDSPWPAARVDSRPRVLFVMNRDLRCDPEFGPSPYFCDCVSSLVSSGAGHAQYFFMDRVLRYGTAGVAGNLVALCQRIYPDFIFYLPIQDLAYHTVNVPIETLMYLRERMKIPVMTAIGDAWLYDSEHLRQTRIFAEVSDRVIIGEPRSPAFQDAQIAPKLLELWFPRDEILFSPGERRDIPLSFIGSVQGYVDREAGLAELKSRGVAPAYFGPTNGRYVLTFAQIADLYRRSRMTINFTRINNVFPIRGRVWEALLSGCLLFEEAGSSTEEFFVPNVDYIPFDSASDLAMKITHFRQHPKAADEIARHGMAVAREKYAAARYWESVFQAVEIAREA